VTAEELMQDAARLPEGADRLDMLREAVAIADAAGQARLGFEARLALVDAAALAGATRTQAAAMAWCLGKVDTDPDRFPATPELLARAVVVVERLGGLADLSADGVRAAVDDVAGRLERAGLGARAVARLRWVTALALGRPEEELVELHRAWRLAGPDELPSCQACDAGAEVAWLAARGEDEAALSVAEPLLSGEIGCEREPSLALAALLGPRFRLGASDPGHYALAAAGQLRAAQLADAGNVPLAAMAGQLSFMLSIGDLASGVMLIGQLLPKVVASEDDLDRLRFLGPAARVLELASEEGPGPLLTVRAGEQMTAADLVPVLRAAASEVAGAFDARNGTTGASDRLARVLAVDPPGRAHRAARERVGQGLVLAAEHRNEEAVAELEAAAGAYRGLDPERPGDVLAGTTADALAFELAGCEVILAGALAALDRREEAMGLLRGARETFDTSPLAAAGQSGHCSLTLARVLDAGGRTGEALAEAVTAIAAFEVAGDFDQAGEAGMEAAAMLHRLGRNEEALQASMTAAEHWRASGTLTAAALARSKGGLLLAQMGRHDEGLDMAEAAVRALSMAGDAHGQALCDGYAARILAAAGRNAEAAERCRAAMEQLAAAGDEASRAELATLLDKLGRLSA
jgi:tetratricopeptide (TPR) repeat protein